MATSLLALVVASSILLFYGWKATTVVTSPVPLYYCQDHVGMDMTCEDIPYFCNNTYAKMVCPLKCGFCVPQSPITAPPHSTTDGDCFDRIVNDLTCDHLDNFCGDRYAVLLCAATCNFCRPKEQTFQPRTTVADSLTVFTSPSPQECVDDVKDPNVCNYPNICSSENVRTVCRKSCGLCCADHLRDNGTCELFKQHYKINPCRHQLGRAACAKFCGVCV